MSSKSFTFSQESLIIELEAEHIAVLERSSDLIRWERVESLDTLIEGQKLQIPIETQKETTFARLHQIDLRSLQGEWSGTLGITKVGNCTVDGKSSVEEDVRVDVSVASRNLIEFTPYYSDGSAAFEFDIFGSVSNGANFTMLRRDRRSCDGESLFNTYDYEGSVGVSDEGVPTITLFSREQWCPVLNCVFDVILILEKSEDEQ